MRKTGKISNYHRTIYRYNAWWYYPNKRKRIREIQRPIQIYLPRTEYCTITTTTTREISSASADRCFNTEHHTQSTRTILWSITCFFFLLFHDANTRLGLHLLGELLVCTVLVLHYSNTWVALIPLTHTNIPISTVWIYMYMYMYSICNVSQPWGRACDRSVLPDDSTYLIVVCYSY